MFFWNSLAFSTIQRMLAIWSLVPLPFLKPAWTSVPKALELFKLNGGFPGVVAIVQSVSHAQSFATPWTAAHQASLSIILSQSSLKFMSTESVMLSNCLILPGASVLKNLPVKQETQVWPLGQEDPPEKEMATHSSILTWKVPWTRGAWWAASMRSLESDMTQGLDIKTLLLSSLMQATWL